MKTKTFILIAFAAILTLSFSFASSSSRNAEKVITIEAGINSDLNAPVGGFIAEDKF